MIYSIVPTDVVFFDNTQIRQRHLKMYNNVTLELTDGRVERIISTNPQDYLKYHNLLGSNNIQKKNLAKLCLMVYNVTDCRTRGNTLMKEEKNMQDNVYDVLLERGLIAQTTHEQEIRELLGKEKVNVLYWLCTQQQTAFMQDTFCQMVVMRHMQNYGHRPIALVGGGTGHIGDPSGRTDMRQMMTKEIIDHNCECFKQQLSRVIDFSDDKAIMVNNADWLLDLNYVEFFA